MAYIVAVRLVVLVVLLIILRLGTGIIIVLTPMRMSLIKMANMVQPIIFLFVTLAILPVITTPIISHNAKITPLLTVRFIIHPFLINTPVTHI